MENIKPVIFKLQGEKYGIDINLVSGIEREQKIVSVPNAPDNIKGIINMRGIIVPVYNLARKFGFEDIDQKDSQLIITRINDMYLAVEVEGVQEIFDISGASLSEVPKIVLGSKTSYIKEVAKVKDELIIIIDIDKLLSEDEQKDMEEFVNEQKGTE